MSKRRSVNYTQRQATQKLNMRRWRLQKTYGLSLESFNTLLESQGNRCAICQGVSEFCVDHDHDTGQVRGILCQSCNRALGMMKDNPSIAQQAAEYLFKHYRLKLGI